MKTNLKMNFTVDKENKKISVEREFAAPLKNVWAAWTEAELLDQWWAPKPWKAQTKSMDFREGGTWLYCMAGPEGEKHWCRADYTSIAPMKRYAADDAFCDENGNINSSEFPGSHWENTFTENEGKTLVSIEISYADVSGLEKTLEMGFREGFDEGLKNLDELLASGK